MFRSLAHAPNLCISRPANSFWASEAPKVTLTFQADETHLGKSPPSFFAVLNFSGITSSPAALNMNDPPTRQPH